MKARNRRIIIIYVFRCYPKSSRILGDGCSAPKSYAQRISILYATFSKSIWIGLAAWSGNTLSVLCTEASGNRPRRER